MRAQGERLLVVTADDFGVTPEANAAIRAAHENGILTAASLMVNERGADDAVRLARTMPSLAVGLHLALSDGLAALPHSQVPRVVASDGRLRTSPTMAGLVYALSGTVHRQVKSEIAEQVARYARTGLRPSHLDGHQHLHLHPVVWDLAIAHCVSHAIGWIRVPREPLHTLFSVSPRRLIEWAALRAVSVRCVRSAQRHGLKMADHVYGHIGSGQMGELRVLHLIERLQPGVSEIYLHPGAHPAELRALTTTRVGATIAQRDVRLTSFVGDGMLA